MPLAGSYGELLDALRGVTWPARRTIRGPAAGTHPSRQRGVSPEFTEYRPYRQGDDPRRLDWKLLARTDRAFLRITNDRATLGTVLVSALALLRPTQRIVLISDFLAEDDELLRAARERITAGADVLAVHIVAREELEPARAAIIAVDPERAELERPLVDETREG